MPPIKDVHHHLYTIGPFNYWGTLSTDDPAGWNVLSALTNSKLTNYIAQAHTIALDDTHRPAIEPGEPLELKHPETGSLLTYCYTADYMTERT